MESRSTIIKRLQLKRLLTDIFLIITGILAAGFGLKGFLLPNGFIDGGVTGISLLTNLLSNIPLSILLFIINLPFIWLGYKLIGAGFAVKTLCAIIGLALCLVVVEYPIVTSDKLLVAIFGGFFLGAGIGLAIRGGSVIDGTEVLAVFISRRINITVGDFILIINVIIFSVAIIFLSVETALYSILTYLAASKTVDFITQGIEEYTGVTIISLRSNEIRSAIIHKLGRGVTLLKGERGFGKRGENKNQIDIVYTVITRLEVGKLKAEVEKIDPTAFIVMNPVNDTIGGMIKKRPLHFARKHLKAS